MKCKRCNGNGRIELLEHCPDCNRDGRCDGEVHCVCGHPEGDHPTCFDLQTGMNCKGWRPCLPWPDAEGWYWCDKPQCAVQLMTAAIRCGVPSVFDLNYGGNVWVYRDASGGAVRLETPDTLSKALWDRLKAYVEILKPDDQA